MGYLTPFLKHVLHSALYLQSFVSCDLLDVWYKRYLPAMQETGFDSGKIPWRRKWQPTPVFLSGKSHGQRSLQATVHEVARVRHDLATKPLPPQ